MKVFNLTLAEADPSAGGEGTEQSAPEAIVPEVSETFEVTEFSRADSSGSGDQSSSVDEGEHIHYTEEELEQLEKRMKEHDIEWTNQNDKVSLVTCWSRGARAQFLPSGQAFTPYSTVVLTPRATQCSGGIAANLNTHRVLSHNLKPLDCSHSTLGGREDPTLVVVSFFFFGLNISSTCFSTFFGTFLFLLTLRSALLRRSTPLLKWESIKHCVFCVC